MTNLKDQLFEAIKKDTCISGSLHERVQLNKLLIEICEAMENFDFDEERMISQLKRLMK